MAILATGKIEDHVFREAILSEIHARPVEMLPQTCRIRRLIVAIPTDPGSIAAAVDALGHYCRDHAYPAPVPLGRQHRFSAGGRQVTWEFHNEFLTVTWWAALDDGENWPRDIGLEAAESGSLVGAARIDVIGDVTIPERLLPGFNIASLCLSSIEGEKAQVATDFICDDDGFTRLELAAGGLTALRRSIIVRRLLEIETYRSMAMLGLPVAQQKMQMLRSLELELSELVGTLTSEASSTGLQAVLARLHELSVRSGQLNEHLSYRFAASQAYGNIVRARLSGLHESPTSSGSTLTNFIGNRIDPSLATCAAMERRLSVFAQKIEHVTGLLDVRVGIDIQNQTADVLHSIARTAGSQFQLQRTVEGLSIIAISYYLIGIVNYLLAAPLEQFHWNKGMATSIVAPATVLVVWLMMRGIHRKHRSR